MADDKQQQDRTEQPTPKRLADARKKGDVPRSRELTMTGVTMAGAASMLYLAGPMGSQLIDSFKRGFIVEREHLADDRFLAHAFAELASQSFTALIPLALILFTAVFASAALIGGWSFSTKAMAFKLERMSPLKGIKRIFSSNGLHELVKAMAKFTIIAVIAVLWLWWSVDDLIALGRQPVGPAIGRALQICGTSLLVISSGLIFIAAADVPFQLWNYKKKLKMTRQEIRDEFKETEGRPEVKSRIRVLQQQIATRRMMEELPTADVVITNPTHFAIALKYDEAKMSAPKVLAKGQDLIAKRIREIAAEHKIPLFSAPPLARALFRSTEIGHEIPAKLYTAVAQVLAYILQLNETLKPGQRRLLPPVPVVDEDEFPAPLASTLPSNDVDENGSRPETG